MNSDEKSDVLNLIRLALTEQTEDVRMFVARLVRKYRNTDPDLAEQINLYLRIKPGSNAIMKEQPRGTNHEF